MTLKSPRTLRTGSLLVGLIVLCGTGCLNSNAGVAVTGSGVAKSETRQVGAFDAIRVDGTADVEATISDHTEVIVTTDDNLLPLIKTTLSGSTLVISETEEIHSKAGIKVTIKTPKLSATTISGTGTINAKGLKGPSFTADINGTGSIAADGAVDKLDAKMNGTGQINLVDLAARDATVSVNGTGTTKVNATATLGVTISGTGNVEYKGSPKVTQAINGVGKVLQIP